MKVRTLIATGILAAVSALAAPVQAATINFGVDVRGDGSTEQVGFYDGQPAKGGDTGYVLSLFSSSLTVGVATPGLAGATIHGIELFIDATDVDCNTDGCDGDSPAFVRFRLVPGDDKLTFSVGSSTQYLGDTGSATQVPTEFGPLGDRVLSPYPTDVDNSFFLTWVPEASVAAQIQAGSLDLSFNWNFVDLGDLIRFGRIDGVNLKVDYTPASDVPEPTSLALLGAAVAGVAARWRRRQ
ncbi:MAG TPA: PEP-CTERM sorting domain-containing protein [Luteitalea sp.]|nr:PEP-CTERM sorting domain-containing protein [Luteitalea sp.]